jgi:tetratricopeptide (TPR) repeat protein
MNDPSSSNPTPEAFELEFWNDVFANSVRPLEEYLAEFPGADEAIQRAYREERGSRPADTQCLGPYQIVREIGRGSQGIVYLAEDTNLHREVALKVLNGTLSTNPGATRRFRREAEVTSRLDHPGICPVYAAGEDRGRFWIAMRYVEGEALSSEIARARTRPESASGPVEWNEIARVLRLFEQAARALHLAHENGVIHRDIKPGNLIVAKDGAPVIADFGLAHSAGSDQATLTTTGDLLGSPAYMSPEQLDTQQHALDRRTDVYSLGVSLYERLTLRRPFDSPTREGLYRAILTEDFAAARKLNHALPSDLEVVLGTALEKDRDRRYQTALALAEDIRRVREHEPILAKPVGPIGRIRRFARRRPAVATLIGVLVLAVPTIAGLGGFLAANWDEIEEQRNRVIDAEVESALEDGYLKLAEGAPREAIAYFDRALAKRRTSPEATAGKAMALSRQRRFAEALAVLDSSGAGGDAGDALEMLRAGALESLGRRPEAEALRGRLKRPSSSLGLFLVGQREAEKGDASDEKGDRDSYRRAVEAFEDAVTRAKSARLLYTSALLRAAADARDSDLVRRTLPALELLWPESGLAWYQAAYGLSRIRDFEGAIVANRRAIAIDPNRKEAHYNLGHALVHAGRHAEAIEVFRGIISREPRYAPAHTQFALVLLTSGNLDEALVEARRAVELDPDDILGREVLSTALRDVGRFREADSEFERSVGLRLTPDSRRLNMINSQRDEMELTVAFEDALDRLIEAGEPPAEDDLVMVALVASGRELHARAANLFEEAFAHDSSLRDVRGRNWLDRAARSAVIAASGGGLDGAGLDPPEFAGSSSSVRANGWQMTSCSE